MMRVATWNVNSLRVRITQVQRWLIANQPDVLALQETKMTNDVFPFSALAEVGYTAIAHGQPTYNGVALLSREQSEDSLTVMPAYADPQCRLLAATIGGVRIINVYVPNGQSVGSDKYRYKLDWLQGMNAFLQREIHNYPHVIVLGDFNIAPASQDVYDPLYLQGQVLVSELERVALQAWLALGLKDCFRLSPQPANSFTWWDYRQNAYRRNLGLRIDHILATEGLANDCRRCYIDRDQRACARPSDHVPVVAEFELAST